MLRVLVVAAILTAGPVIAAAQPRIADEPTLTVQGQGRIEVPPDRASLTVDVVTTGRSLAAATAAHRDRAERATQALRDMQGDGLKIDRSTFNLNETHPPSPPLPPGTPPGPDRTEYRAATTFELKLDKLDAIDRVVTAITATGLFEVRNIRFGIADRNPGLRAARKAAVEDAKDKAETYADAAGVQLDSILTIEDGGGVGVPEFAAAPMVRAMKVIPPDTLALTASVTITWRIAPKP